MVDTKLSFEERQVKALQKPYLHPESAYTRRPRTDFIVIHCSADPEEDGINDHAEDIREMHVKENGWLDIGYHFVIERDGLVELGRPHWAVGAAVAGQNSRCLHICMIGGADKNGRGENDFTQAQWDALESLVIQATAWYPDAKVCGHRDFKGVNKDCPSFDAKGWWAEVLQNWGLAQ